MKLFQKLVCMALTATATASLSICAFAADYTFDTAADTDYYPSTSYEDTYGTAYHYGSKNLVDYQIPELPYGVLSTTQTGVMEKLRLPGLQQTVGGSASGIYGVDSGVGIPAVTPVISSYQEPAYTSAKDMERKDGSIGTLKIPSLDINMKVWEGETKESMKKGLGHYDRPISQRHLRSSLKGGRSMLLSNQQKYILEILKEFKYLRVRQLHALVQAHYRTQGIKIDERRMEIMLRQMRTGTNYVWLRGDVVSYGDRRIDPRLLEALDVMLELTRVQPGFYSKDGLHEPFLLRFTGNGKGAGYLFSVAWLDAATHIATVPRMKGERIIWISEIGSFGEIDLPRHHFFAARQENGTHRFFGSNEPEKI